MIRFAYDIASDLAPHCLVREKPAPAEVYGSGSEPRSQ